MDGAKLNAENIARNNRLLAKANARMVQEEHEAELAALRAENERLREALVWFHGNALEWEEVNPPQHLATLDAARAALEGQP